MDNYLKANRDLWNERTAIHAHSDFYDLDGFKKGASSLYPIEREELTGVDGKTLLHLQCHFGLDTMSWARQGAIPTGVDFSDKAIALAKDINRELGLNCTFLHADIYDLPNHLQGQFDIVYTSYGVLNWLPDIRGWAEVVAHFLKPGGTFYIVEIHPFSNTLDDEADDLKIVYPYFHAPEPMAYEPQGSYVDREAEITTPLVYEWSHSLGEVVTALLEAGLDIQYLHEFDYTVFQQVPFMIQKGRLFYLPEDKPSLPLLFSLKAKKLPKMN